MNINQVRGFRNEIEKIAFDGKKFREGLVDEGIPLGGATIGAAIGHRTHNGLRGAALGYAAGGGLSLARSLIKGEKPSHTQALLAGGALGYGAGGGAHIGLSKLTSKAGKGLGKLKGLRKAVHGPATFKQGLIEEGLPAAGATLGTGLAMGLHKEPKTKKASPDLWNPDSGRLSQMSSRFNRMQGTAGGAAAAAAKKPMPSGNAMLAAIRKASAGYGKGLAHVIR